jgi:hypothetical protein
MMAQPAIPAPASHAAAEPPPSAADTSPATAAAGGSTYSHSSPASVPASSAGEYRSCVYALRATMSHRSASRS